MSAEHDEKLRILVNSNSHMTRGKYAAAAVHAALTAAGVHPGLPVIVLGGQRDDVLRCATVIRDAGKTEVEPGTPTAGTDWSPALSTPPADDVREAVAVKRWCSYFGCRVVVYEADDSYGQGCPVCGHVGEAGEVRPHGTVTEAEDVSALRGEPIALSLFRMFVREHDEGDGPERVLVEVADIRTALRLLDARSHGTATDAEVKSAQIAADAMGVPVPSRAMRAALDAAREVHP